MKKYTFTFAGAAATTLIALSTSAAIAHSPAETEKESSKIAIIDSSKIFDKSETFKNINDQVKDKSEKFGEQIRKNESKLRKQLSELESQKSALSKESLDKKNDVINKGFLELQQKAVAGREALQKTYEKSMQNFINHLNSIVAKVAKTHKYTLVIDRNAAQYFDEKIDITEDAVKELNKSNFTVKVDFSEIDKIDVEKSSAANTASKEDKPVASKAAK